MNLNQTIKLVSEINQNDLDKLSYLVKNAEQILLIGNGGSNAISSHIAVDYNKFLKKKSLAFSDPPMITAYMNDYGVDQAYLNYIHNMSDDNTLVILISSSGNSRNIYNAAEHCKNNNIKFILLTGFNFDNLVRRNFQKFAELDYWIDSQSYGVVECVHQIFLHSIIDN